MNQCLYTTRNGDRSANVSVFSDTWGCNRKEGDGGPL